MVEVEFIETTSSAWGWMEFLAFAFLLFALSVLVATAIHFYVSTQSNDLGGIVSRLVLVEIKQRSNDELFAALNSTSATRIDKVNKLDETVATLADNLSKTAEKVAGIISIPRGEHAKEGFVQGETEAKESTKGEGTKSREGKIRKKETASGRMREESTPEREAGSATAESYREEKCEVANNGAHSI